LASDQKSDRSEPDAGRQHAGAGAWQNATIDAASVGEKRGAAKAAEIGLKSRIVIVAENAKTTATSIGWPSFLRL
jgi:hypothetical protein